MAQATQGRLHGYSLSLKPSVISTGGSQTALDLTDLAQGWNRSIQLQGGPFSGSFTVPLGKRAFDAFETWLGCHVEERSGGITTFEGLVYEMELSQGGVVQRRSLDDMNNAARGDYDNYRGKPVSTAWVTNAESIARFGRKDDIIEPVSMYPDVVLNLVTRTINEKGWPWPKAVSLSRGDGLSITVNGYVFTANWRYSRQVENTPAGAFGYCVDSGGLPGWFSIGTDLRPYEQYLYAPGQYRAKCSVWVTRADTTMCWGYAGAAHDHTGGGAWDGLDIWTTQDLGLSGVRGWNDYGGGSLPSSWILRQSTSTFLYDLGADLDHLTVGIVDLDDSQVDRAQFTYAIVGTAAASPARCWDTLQECVKQGDSAGNPWRAFVGPGRKVHLTRVSPTPRLFYIANQWCVDTSGTPANPWQMQPGVVRAMDYRYGTKRSGYWLEDPRDFLVEEFSVDSKGQVSPKIANVSQTENLLYYLSALRPGAQDIPNTQNPPNWNVEKGMPNPWGTNAPNMPVVDPTTGLLNAGSKEVPIWVTPEEWAHHGYWGGSAGDYYWVYVPGMASVGQ